VTEPAARFDLLIRGGTVYDPANGVDGESRDLWIRDGRIVSAPTLPDARAIRVIEARGRVVMPGGVDMHCHIAGSKVNLARKMQPDAAREGRPEPGRGSLRSGSGGQIPSTFATGYRYAGLGYTTAFDAAIQPLAARHVHQELADTPCIDKGFYVLAGNSHFLMQRLAAGELDEARDFLAWLLNATRAYALKLVNPGGIEMWKQLRAGNVASIDDVVGHFGVTPRTIVTQAARLATELRLPHAAHIHANHLGVPGNWQTTLETMRAVDGARAHFTHIQFHSYGGSDEASLSSAAAELVEYVDAHKNLTVDVGQVLFGRTTSMTGDGPLGHFLHQVYGGKWYSADIEQESGCGIVPIEYKEKSLVHAGQWAIGLEWQLLMRDPWRVALSTDHPNGGSFLAYPQIIRLLMDRDYRQSMLKQAHAVVREKSLLATLDREYTLGEICIITRAAPARMLGLKQKGHLGVGADADVTIYDPGNDPAAMFSLPRYVIKAGQVLIDDGELRESAPGSTLHAAPEYDEKIETRLADWFERRYSVRMANFPVSLDEIESPCQIACDQSGD
jgi:formylmethanofuran dehydrogenase subunit A